MCAFLELVGNPGGGGEHPNPGMSRPRGRPLYPGHLTVITNRVAATGIYILNISLTLTIPLSLYTVSSLLPPPSLINLTHVKKSLRYFDVFIKFLSAIACVNNKYRLCLG